MVPLYLVYLAIAALIIYFCFNRAVLYFQQSLILYSGVNVIEILSKAGTLEAKDMLWESLADKSRLILNRVRGLAEKLRQEQIISSQFCKYIIDLVCQQMEIVTSDPGIILESIVIKWNSTKKTQLRQKNEDLYRRICEYNREVREFRFYTDVANHLFNPNKYFSNKARSVNIF